VLFVGFLNKKPYKSYFGTPHFREDQALQPALSDQTHNIFHKKKALPAI